MNFNQALSHRQRKVVAAISAATVGILTYMYSGSLTSKLPEAMQQVARLGLAGATVAVSYSTNSILKDNQGESGTVATPTNSAGASPPPPRGKNTKLNRTDRRAERAKGRTIVSGKEKGQTSKFSTNNAQSKLSQPLKVTTSSKRKQVWNAVSEQTLNEDGTLTITISFKNISGNRFKQMVRNQLSGKFDATWSHPKNLGNGLRSISAVIPAGESQKRNLASILAVTGAQITDCA